MGNRKTDRTLRHRGAAGSSRETIDSESDYAELLRHFLDGGQVSPDLIDLAIRFQPKLIRSPRQYRYAENLIRDGRLDELKAFLNYRGDSAAINGKEFWSRLLGLALAKRGRPRAHSSDFREAARLRSKSHWRWSKIAKRLCPDEFRQDPRKCTDRIKSGAYRVLRLA